MQIKSAPPDGKQSVSKVKARKQELKAVGDDLMFGRHFVPLHFLHADCASQIIDFCYRTRREP